jgi:hypothetical protein
MRVCAARSAGDPGGRRAGGVLTRDATPGWGRHSFVVPSSFICAAGLEPWRNRKRTRLSIGGVRVQVPSVPLSLEIGFCSSPVERLVEAQRAAGSIPAGAIVLNTPPWRNGRRATLRTSWARPVGVQVPPAAWRCRVAQRQSGGLISRVRRGFESRPCNPAPVAQLAEHPPRKREGVGSDPTRSLNRGWWPSGKAPGANPATARRARGGSIPPHSVQVRSSTGRARDCGPRGGGSSPPHLISPAPPRYRL